MTRFTSTIHDSIVAVKNFFHWLIEGLREGISAIPNSVVKFRFWALTFRGSITILSLIGLILIPLLTDNEYYIQIIITAMIFSIFAASWDMLAGFAGQVSFGHSVFFGISAYITAAAIDFFEIHWLVALLLGSLAAVLFSIVIGIPCLRLRGPYLALGTLAFSLILYYLFNMGNWLGGQEGISQLPRIMGGIPGFFMSLGFMVLSLVAMIKIVNSKTGTVFKAIRDDETGADASGINTTKYKIAAFVLSGFFAGIAGGLLVLNNTAVNPAIYQPLYSFYAIVMASIGGIGTIVGSIAGSFLYWVLSEFLRPLSEAALLVFATILILIIRFADQGVMNPVLEGIQDFYDMIRGR